MGSEWHKKQAEEILSQLNGHKDGLKKEEVARFLKFIGENTLPQAKPEGTLTIFLRQFKSPLIYILLLSGLVVLFMGELIDAFVIIFVILFNSIIGTLQEGKARDTLSALKEYVKTNATVIRDGKELIIEDTQIVPGDIILLEEGEKVPADARVILSNNLKINESALTGESIPKAKHAEVIEADSLPIGEQDNMLFKGTFAVSGAGKAIVVATGKDTYIGKISQAIQKIDTEIPLKQKIRMLSKLIVIVVLILSAVLFLAGIGNGRGIEEMFIMVVSLAVSIIPEGLPIVLTLVLALGVSRMGKRNVLVKKLQAVEGLGQVDIIAVDKTGTITKNEMVVKRVFSSSGEYYKVDGVGYDHEGGIYNISEEDARNDSFVQKAAQIAALSASAHLSYQSDKKKWNVTGDPTEASLTVFAKKAGMEKEQLHSEFHLIQEMPFDYKKKYRAVMYEHEGVKKIYTIGAPEAIMRLCDIEDDPVIAEAIERMAKQGLRLVAFASAESLEVVELDSLPKLNFEGIFGIKDALRSEVKETVEKLAKANVKVVMITGDYMETAKVIGMEAGIYKPGDLIVTGNDLENNNDEQLLEKLHGATIFARVNPEHKMRIIQAYRKMQKVVAMTGDGVNDAPSLVAADVGVSMGAIGTEVAKEASDIVILDDNFKSIAVALEEGRGIYHTVKRVVMYLFSTSIGEMLAIGSAILLGMPLPILASQVLWLNLVTDGFLDMALAMEPQEKGEMKRKIVEKDKYVVDPLMFKRMLLMGSVMAIGTLILFSSYYPSGIEKARTISLTLLAVYQWINAWNCRFVEKSAFSNFTKNKYLIGASVLVIGLHFVILYVPFFQTIFKTVPLNLWDWAIIVVFAIPILFVEEMRKLFVRKFFSKKNENNMVQEDVFWQPL